MDVEVRPLAPSDNAAAQALVHVAWISGHGHLFPASGEKVRRGEDPDASFSYQVPKTGSVFVAVSNERIVGLINLRPLDDAYGLIEPIAVDPSLHLRGIGTELWNYCLKFAQWHGLKGLQVWAVEGNQKANDFYKGRGCKEFATGSVTFDGVERKATGYLLDF
jgi:GNAT superfamily N-acetyltransferase